MFEEIVEQFTHRLKKIVFQNQHMTQIPLAYLLQLPIPDYIKHFFDQEVELWIREEEEKFTSDRFDYDMPEVRMLIDQIFDLLKQNATFDLRKFNQLLERAVKLEMNYLVEPHRTLSQFLFKNSSEISTMEVYDTLKYFQHYEYYKTAISDYFNLKYLRTIHQTQFDQLMEQIDQQVFSEKRVETTLGVIKTILQFFSDAQDKPVNELSIDLLKHAFRDRNLSDYLELIKEVESNTDLRSLTFEQLEGLLRDGQLPGMVEQPTQREATEIMGFENIQDIESQQVSVEVDNIEFSETFPAVTVDETEELEIEEEEEELESESPLEEQPPQEPEIIIHEEEEEVEVSEEVAESLADHLAKKIASDQPLEDLHQLIKGRTRRKIIKKLFKKKEQDFVDFIDRLNAMTSWKEASRLIDDVFYEKQVNPYSKEAITLSDIIYMRFFPKDSYMAASDEFERFD